MVMMMAMALAIVMVMVVASDGDGLCIVLASNDGDMVMVMYGDRGDRPWWTEMMWRYWLFIMFVVLISCTGTLVKAFSSNTQLICTIFSQATRMLWKLLVCDSLLFILVY